MQKLLRSSCWTALAILGTAGCSAGGPDAPAALPALPPPPPPAPTAPAIVLLPATFDFGKVTSNNDPAPLEVSIGNSGNAPLKVTSIGFGAPSDASFQLMLNGGAAPCGSAAPAIAPGARCTVQVVFDPASNGAFTSTLQIGSNATSGTAAMSVSGVSEPVSRLIVQTNQIVRMCPSNAVVAYVSVTDQGGYPVTGLTSVFFSVTQGATSPVARPVQSSYVDIAYQPIATAAVLDSSNSLTSQPIAFADMKNLFSGYFSAMRTGDAGEVIKFGSEVEVTQPFTADKSALLAAIGAPFDKGGSTKLYDAAVRGADDAAAQDSSMRKAVIVATDGADNASTRALADAIAAARSKGVPLFTVGIGGSINRTILQQMAEDTGGLYYEAGTSQNLATIYQQLSSILYRNQYILTFDQQSGAGSDITIGATAGTLTGSDSSSIPACN